MGFDDILRHINDLADHLVVEDVIAEAQALYRTVIASPTLPRDLAALLESTPESGRARQ